MPLTQQPAALLIQSILFATNFAESSLRAERYAQGIARGFGAAVEITHIFDPSIVSSYEEAIIGFLPADREHNCMMRLSQMKEAFDKVGVQSRMLMVEGHSPAKEIARLAQARFADLVIVGTRPPRGLERAVLRSTADGIIRHSLAPVFTVGPCVPRLEKDELVFGHILYATDFSLDTSRAATYARRFAEDSGCELTCCYLDEHDQGDHTTRLQRQQDFRSAMDPLLPEQSNAWCDPKYFLESSNTGEELLDLALRINADLVVLAAPKPAFWLSNSSGGVLGTLLAKVHCPVLTVA